MTDFRDRPITRQHVLDLLPAMDLSPADRRRVLALPYPVPLPVLAELLNSLGVSTERLIDRMGGNP